MADQIKFFGLNRQYASLRQEILDITDRVYSNGQVLEGEMTHQFEYEIQKRVGRTYAVAVNSCSMALLISYLYYAQQLTSKNLTLPAFSFIATSNAPSLSGYTLKYTDVDEHGMLDIDQLTLREDSIDIVSYVNLYGNILDYNKLVIAATFFNSPIPIIEDAAQSFGATYKGIPSGKLGNVSCLSFDPTKNLPNYGSGGMILTDDRDLYGFAIGFRNNGNGVTHGVIGTNSKMSESDCAQMLIKLKHFDSWQQRRTEIAAFYTEQLSDILVCPTHSNDVVHAWHKYVIKTPDQFELRKHLHDAGVESRIHYQVPLSDFNNAKNAEQLAVQSVSLPIYPELLDSEVEYVVDTIHKFYS